MSKKFIQHQMTIIPLDARSSITGRYSVHCLTCREVVHEGISAPEICIAAHLATCQLCEQVATKGGHGYQHECPAERYIGKPKPVFHSFDHNDAVRDHEHSMKLWRKANHLLSKLDPTDDDVVTVRVGPVTFRSSEVRKHIDWDVDEGTTLPEFYSAYAQFCLQTTESP